MARKHHGKVLLVEHDFADCEYARLPLEDAGFEVTVVASRAGAQKAMASDPGRYDAVVMDLGLPNQRGEESPEEGLSLLKWIKRSRNIPSIVVTGKKWPMITPTERSPYDGKVAPCVLVTNFPEGDFGEICAPLAFYFMNKPYNPDRLVEFVAELVSQGNAAV